jgi:hypothetical protein
MDVPGATRGNTTGPVILFAKHERNNSLFSLSRSWTVSAIRIRYLNA